MHKTSLLRVAAALTFTALLGVGSQARADKFPALNDPATTESHPGKFVWAELFASDTAAASKFYTGVLGWTATSLDQHGVAYVIFSNGGRPVAGIRQRSEKTPGRASRWINYIAVKDVDATLAVATKSGGETRAPARKFPDLGSMAIVTDPEGSPFGLIQSTSGDSADNEPAPGDWNWFHLFVKTPKAAADYYGQVFGYTSAADSRPGSGTEILLATGNTNRGGVSTLPAADDAKPGWLGVIRVANLDQALAKVPALGGLVAVAPHEAVLGSRFAVVTDPTGGSVGVIEYVNNLNPANR